MYIDFSDFCPWEEVSPIPSPEYPDSCWLTAPDLPQLLDALKELATLTKDIASTECGSLPTAAIYDAVRLDCKSDEDGDHVSFAAAVDLMAHDILWTFSCNAKGTSLTTTALIHDPVEAPTALPSKGDFAETRSPACEEQPDTTVQASIHSDTVITTPQPTDIAAPFNPWRREEYRTDKLRKGRLEDRVGSHMRDISCRLLEGFTSKRPDAEGLIETLNYNQFVSLKSLSCSVPSSLTCGIQCRLDGTDTSKWSPATDESDSFDPLGPREPQPKKL
jgi:hypothetical protein